MLVDVPADDRWRVQQARHRVDPGQEVVKALQGKKGGASSAKAGEIVNFSQAKHAFSSSANPTNPFADQSVPLANPPANESNNGAKQSSSKPDLEAEANLRNELNMAQALLDEEIKRAESFQQERQLLQNEIARLQQETSQVRQRAETDSVRTANEIQNTLSREISRLKKELADEINRRDSIEKNRSELEHNISALRKDLDNTRQHADLQAQRIETRKYRQRLSGSDRDDRNPLER